MQYMIATRYKQGLKEREKGFRKPFKERYEAENGAGPYKSSYLAGIKEDIGHAWSEMLFIRADLGSK
jgi:hypothetical protein